MTDAPAPHPTANPSNTRRHRCPTRAPSASSCRMTQQTPPRVRAHWTPAKQRVFLAALVETGSIARAARAAGMSRSSAHALRNRPTGTPFDYAWSRALELHAVRLADPFATDPLTPRKSSPAPVAPVACLMPHRCLPLTTRRPTVAHLSSRCTPVSRRRRPSVASPAGRGPLPVANPSIRSAARALLSASSDARVGPFATSTTPPPPLPSPHVQRSLSPPRAGQDPQ